MSPSGITGNFGIEFQYESQTDQEKCIRRTLDETDTRKEERKRS